jgi:hypothetical protein
MKLGWIAWLRAGAVLGGLLPPGMAAGPAAAEAEVVRQVYFGEQHPHTSWSFDAFGFGNALTGPEDFYRYALGQPTPQPGGCDVTITKPLAAELRTIWTDPDFDPSLDAFYCARVLEIPTPRWSSIQAAKLGRVRPAGVAATIQERAWSSPITGSATATWPRAATSTATRATRSSRRSPS